MPTHPFRTAVEAWDHDAIDALLAEDVTFRSPVVHGPSSGRETVGALLRVVATVFEDFRYERGIGDDGPGDHVLVFHARVGDREVQGIDLLHTREDGLVDELTVMVRPMSGAVALAEAMKARLAAAGG